MSNSPSRCPTNARVLPSGDQPCQYDGDFFVIRRGCPPPNGSTYTLDSWSACDWSLIASSELSGEIPGSLLHPTANPVSITSGEALPSAPSRKILPSRLNNNAFPSRVQFGASNRPCATYTAVRSFDPAGIVSRKLYNTESFPLAVELAAALLAACSLTSENTAFSTTSLSWLHTPMPT